MSDNEDIMKKVAPTLVHAATTLNIELVDQILNEGFAVDFPVTDIGIRLFAYVCSFAPARYNSDDGTRKKYIKLLKSIYKRGPNLFANDFLGRNCLHMAARACNLVGIQFIMQAVERNYLKAHPDGVPQGQQIPDVQNILDARTVGGISPLMEAAGAGSIDCVLFMLRLGSNPWFHDVRGIHRTAAWYARVNHPQSNIAELLEQYIAEIEQPNQQ